jgi:hypothetical protein
VSWCPLGFDNRPIFGINGYHAGPGHYSPWRGWTAVSYSSFGGRDHWVNQRAVNWDRQAGPRPHFETRPSAPGLSRDVAVPRNSTPIRWAGSRNSPPNGAGRDLGRDDARRAVSSARDSLSPARTGASAPRTGASTARDAAPPARDAAAPPRDSAVPRRDPSFRHAKDEMPTRRLPGGPARLLATSTAAMKSSARGTSGRRRARSRRVPRFPETTPAQRQRSRRAQRSRRPSATRRPSDVRPLKTGQGPLEPVAFRVRRISRTGSSSRRVSQVRREASREATFRVPQGRRALCRGAIAARSGHERTSDPGLAPKPNLPRSVSRCLPRAASTPRLRAGPKRLPRGNRRRNAQRQWNARRQWSARRAAPIVRTVATAVSLRPNGPLRAAAAPSTVPRRAPAAAPAVAAAALAVAAAARPPRAAGVEVACEFAVEWLDT